MLLYVSSGARAFGKRPVRPCAREGWEFYAVLEGKVAPWLPDERKTAELEGRKLWVFPPGHVHGWRGEKGRAAKVAVFMFERVAPELAEKVEAGEGVFGVPIDHARAGRLVGLAHALNPLLLGEKPFARLRAERAMLELAIMALEPPAPKTEVVFRPEGVEERVEAAEQWFLRCIEESPTPVSVACRLGISAGQMRRLFVEARGSPPRVVFERMRTERAEELLRTTGLKLSAVAAMSGYASASAFSQAFKKTHGATPDAWRRSIEQRTVLKPEGTSEEKFSIGAHFPCAGTNLKERLIETVANHLHH